MNESPAPQPVTEPTSPAAIVLVLTIGVGGEGRVRSLLAEVDGWCRAAGFRQPGSALEVIVGIGSQAWDRLFSGPRPAHLRPFPELRGRVHRAPSTPGDLLLLVRAMSQDACFDLARRLVTGLAGAATVVDEVHCFRYLENRDLIGFADGTANPTGRDAIAAALVGAEDPAFAGGSYVLVQRYVHDLAAWEELPVPEQEKVVGRTKLGDVEMNDSAKPANSHVALTSLTNTDGAPVEIVRAAMPYGRVGGEAGTCFVAFSRDPAITERMLENMVVGVPPGNHDRLLDFSTAVTGTSFFAPSLDFLAAPPAAP